MITRDDIEQREIAWLATYAVKSKYTRGRAYPEEEHPYRTVFQRDKDRILFSAAFRRLQYKTQVFSNFEGDHYRTRLTHTLEVSQIARSIARTICVNEDLSEAIALAHDLGHGPFGHIGERILARCMEEHGGFEHNTQSLRVVEELEDIYSQRRGLNLTFETCEGLEKHTYDSAESTVPRSFSTLEAQIVDVADEIAYNSHDLDDGLRSRLFSSDDLKDLSLYREIHERIRHEHPQATRYQYVRLLIRYLINEQVTDLLAASESVIRSLGITTCDDVRQSKRRIISFSEPMNAKRKELKNFLHTYFYQNPRVMKIVTVAETCLEGLFRAFAASPSLMPRHFYDKTLEPGSHPLRIVCDYIAGMTDRYALEEYERLTNGKK